MSEAELRSPEVPPGVADAVLNALPLPVVIIDSDGRIADANVAAENFFEASVLLLRRQMLRDLVPFGGHCCAGRTSAPSRRRGERIQGRSVDPRNPATGWSICTSPRSPAADHVVVMLRAHHRRQDGSPTHPPGRGALGERACRHAAHEIKNPLSGIAARRSCSNNRPTTTTAR